MSVDFTVQHQKLAEVNGEIARAVSNMKTILDNLNDVLKGMASATGGAALPLWQGRQNTWNSMYEQMHQELGTHSATSDEIAEIFKAGDRSGANAIGG